MGSEGGGELMPLDYHEFYPELHGYLVKPLLVNPPMCQLHQLQDGTYSIFDLEMMHQVIEIRTHMSPAKAIESKAPTLDGIYG